MKKANVQKSTKTIRVRMNSLKECREISLSVSLTLLTQNLQVELLGVLQTRS